MFGGVMMMQRHAVSGGGTPPAGYFGTLPSIGSGGTSGASGTGVAPLLAFDPSLLTGADGSAITSVPDQCGSGVSLTPPSGYVPSLAVGAMNGLNAVNLSDTYKALQATGISAALNGFQNNDWTLLQVIKVSTWGNGGGQTMFIGSANGGLQCLDNNSGPACGITTYEGSYTTNLSVNRTSDAVFVKVIRVSHSAGSLTSNISGNTGTTSLPWNYATAFDRIKVNFISDPSNGYGISGLHGEFVIWPAAATDAQVSALMTQQHAKWG